MWCLCIYHQLLKSKSGRPERSSQLGNPTIYTSSKSEQTPTSVSHRGQKSRCSSAAAKTSVKKCDNSNRQRPQFTCKEAKKPFTLADNVSFENLCRPEFVPEDNLKDGEKVYAGPKFSEPPSPSVLPKPPSHWVGENTPPCASDGREQMTSHLKSLLKVSDKPWCLVRQQEITTLKKMMPSPLVLQDFCFPQENGFWRMQMRWLVATENLKLLDIWSIVLQLW